jgi:hypothetical protein
LQQQEQQERQAQQQQQQQQQQQEEQQQQQQSVEQQQRQALELQSSLAVLVHELQGVVEGPVAGAMQHSPAHTHQLQVLLSEAEASLSRGGSLTLAGSGALVGAPSASLNSGSPRAGAAGGGANAAGAVAGASAGVASGEGEAVELRTRLAEAVTDLERRAKQIEGLESKVGTWQVEAEVESTCWVLVK